MYINICRKQVCGHKKTDQCLPGTGGGTRIDYTGHPDLSEVMEMQ